MYKKRDKKEPKWLLCGRALYILNVPLKFAQ